MIDEDAKIVNAALIAFVQSFARVIAQELRRQQAVQLAPQTQTSSGTTSNQRLLTAKEPADFLQVAPNTVYEISHWKGPDGLRSVRTGRTVRFRMEDINAHLDRKARGDP